MVTNFLIGYMLRLEYCTISKLYTVLNNNYRVEFIVYIIYKYTRVFFNGIIINHERFF